VNLVKVKIIDLVGKNVKGIIANVVHQGGKFHYDYQDVPLMAPLERVRRTTNKARAKGDWVHWHWQEPLPEQSEARKRAKFGSSCKFSGLQLGEFHPPEDTFLLIDQTAADRLKIPYESQTPTGTAST
jgi:hypothetical protein